MTMRPRCLAVGAQFRSARMGLVSSPLFPRGAR